MKYLTDVKDDHERNEELQWAEIISSGHSAAGMAVIFIQKLCAAFHEFGPAFDNNALKDEHLAFFKKRMANRIRKVLSSFMNNKMEHINGVDELKEILRKTEAAASLKDLASLTEDVHMVNHRLCDALFLLTKKQL